MKTPKTLLTTLLSATLILAPISASANTIATPTPNTINFPMPDVKDVAKKIAKVGRVNAVQFAVGRLFDGIDWVMDPANNRIIIKGNMYCHQASECVKNEQEAEEHALNSSFIFVKHWKYPFLGCRIQGTNLDIVCTFQKDGDIRRMYYIRHGQKTISYDKIAQEILNNALQGHLESIKFVQEVAEEKAREEGQPIVPPTNPPLNPPAIPPQPISPPNTDPTTAPPQPIAGNPTQPIIRKKSQAQCDKEWKDAERICKELIKQGDSNGVTGGYTDPFECSRGLVSQQCGGNKIEW